MAAVQKARKARSASELLKSHRESIDRLDAVLIYTLAERFMHTENVGKLKAKHNLPPSDPDREAWQLERLEQLSRSANLDPVFARKFISFIFEEVIRSHIQKQS